MSSRSEDTPPITLADPFGAAPFDADKIRKHREKYQKQSTSQAKQSHLQGANDSQFTVPARNLNEAPPVAAAANPGNYDFWV